MDLNYYVCRFFVCLLVFCVTEVYAQFDYAYNPIVFTPPIPAAFLQSSYEKTKVNIKQELAAKDLNRRQNRQFYMPSNYELTALFLSGDIYFNDTLTAYVRKVAKNLLRYNNLPLSYADKIYIGKYTVANATTWRDGTILVNLGFLVKLESEGQLAFVLAHEIAHYHAQHHLQQFTRKYQTNKRWRNPLLQKTKHTALFTAAYAQSHELAADSLGALWLEKAGYEGHEVLGLLKLLPTIDDDANKLKLSAYELLQYTLSDSLSLLCTINDLSQRDITSQRGLTKPNSAILQNHPAIEDRIASMTVLLLNKHQDIILNKLDTVKAKATFSYATTVASFEMLKVWLANAQYGRCLYESALLLQRYPNNVFIHEMLVQSAYWLVYYKQMNSLESVLEEIGAFEEQQYGLFLCELGHLINDDFETLVLSFIAQYRLVSTGSKIIQLYYARICELSGLNRKAQEQYLKYTRLFPNTRYTAFVEKRLWYIEKNLTDEK